MIALVTGANGFVGSCLVKKLISNGVYVVAVDKSFNNNKLPDSKLIYKITCNLSEIDCNYLLKFIDKIDIFYHLAWAGVNGEDKSSYEVQINNILITLKCAKIAKSMGCVKFLCSGTIAERSVESLNNLLTINGGMMYASAKSSCHLLLETYCKHIGLNFVRMQFSNIYGPTNKTGNLISYVLEKLLLNEKAVFGPCNQFYDFIFIDDLIEAVFRLGTMITNFNFYYIGSGEPRLLKNYLRIIGSITGKEELIIIGKREDDGIVYNYDMFDVTNLINDIGNYVSDTFENHIKFTIKNY